MSGEKAVSTQKPSAAAVKSKASATASHAAAQGRISGHASSGAAGSAQKIAAKPGKAVLQSLKVSSQPMSEPVAPIRPEIRRVRKPVVYDPNYRPNEDEEFMNDQQLDYFRRRLLAWKEEILHDSRETLATLQMENENHPDLADRASSETDRAIELRARDRQRKLIAKIDSALGRIADGSYGYCEETGEPISLRRLEARPIATLSLEAQERHERNERVYRDD